jgi:hypothetical protein
MLAFFKMALEFSDKKNSPKVEVHDKKKSIIWKGCIDGFS